MIKRELKSLLLKLNLNIGTRWNIYLSLILDSIFTTRKFKLMTYRMPEEKNSPPGLDGSMRKMLHLLDDQMNFL